MTAATAPAPRVRVIAPGVSGDDLSAAGAPRNTPEPKRTGWPRGKKASKTRKPHKCKLCDQPGHNRLTCKKAKSKHAAPAAATRTRQLPALRASRAPQIGGGGRPFEASVTPDTVAGTLQLLQILPEQARGDLLLAIAEELKGRIRFTVSLGPRAGRG